MTKLKVGDTGTVDGRPARVIATDIKGEWPVVIAVERGIYESIYHARSDGRIDATLRFIPTPQKTVRYANWGKTREGKITITGTYESRAEADKWALSTRVACVKIEEGRYDD